MKQHTGSGKRQHALASTITTARAASDHQPNKAIGLTGVTGVNNSIDVHPGVAGGNHEAAIAAGGGIE